MHSLVALGFLLLIVSVFLSLVVGLGVLVWLGRRKARETQATTEQA